MAKMFVVTATTLDDDGDAESGPNPHAELIEVALLKFETEVSATNWISCQKNYRHFRVAEERDEEVLANIPNYSQHEQILKEDEFYARYWHRFS